MTKNSVRRLRERKKMARRILNFDRRRFSDARKTSEKKKKTSAWGFGRFKRKFL